MLGMGDILNRYFKYRYIWILSRILCTNIYRCQYLLIMYIKYRYLNKNIKLPIWNAFILTTFVSIILIICSYYSIDNKNEFISTA